MTRRDPRRLDEAVHRARSLVNTLDRQLPAAARVTETLEELAHLIRDQPRALPPSTIEVIQRALLQAQRTVGAAHTIGAIR